MQAMAPPSTRKGNESHDVELFGESDFDEPISELFVESPTAHVPAGVGLLVADEVGLSLEALTKLCLLVFFAHDFVAREKALRAAARADLQELSIVF